MIKKIFVLFISWRIILFIVAYLAGILLQFKESFPYSNEILKSTGLPYWIWSFGNFDGVHYLTIAKSGYVAQYTQAFFPLYPIIIRIFGDLFLFKNYLLSALIISNVSFFLSICILAKLLELDKQKDYWPILFMICFPFSFFFGAIYNESLFLVFILGSFYAIKTNKIMLAGIFGFLASALRLVGVFLLPAIIIECLTDGEKKKDITVRKNIIPLFIIPMGLIFYMSYLGLVFGDVFYFLHAQPFFGADRTGGQFILLPQVIWRYIKIFATVNMSNYAFWVAFWEISFFCSGIILLIFGYLKRINKSYLAFSFLALIGPTLTGTFSSIPRYLLVCFPIYMVLGQINNKTVKIILLIISFSLLVIFTSLFTRGYWVS